MSTLERNVALRGEIDLANAEKMKVALDFAVATGSDVTVDCSQLTFIDSSGIRVLVDTGRVLARRDRRIRLVNVTGGPRRAIELLGLGGVLNLDGATDDEIRLR